MKKKSSDNVMVAKCYTLGSEELRRRKQIGGNTQPIAVWDPSKGTVKLVSSAIALKKRKK